MTKVFNFEEVRACVAHVSRLFLVTDFDGTLSPIEESPDLVKISGQTQYLLRRLSASPKVVLAVISGRRLEDVQQRVGVPAIYGGNHGMELCGPGIEYIHPEVKSYTNQLNKICTDLEGVVAAWPGAWIENKSLTATVHFRQVPMNDWPGLMSVLRARLATEHERFELRTAHAALELSPRVAWDKGAALKYLRQKLELQHALVICLGDDTTDESMFCAVRDGITIRVGSVDHTEAGFCLPGGVGQVTSFLQQLLEAIEAVQQPSAVWRPPRSGMCRGAAR